MRYRIITVIYTRVSRIVMVEYSRILNMFHLTSKEPDLLSCLLETRPFCCWCRPDGLFLAATRQGRTEGHRKCVRKGNNAMTPTAIDLMKCYMRSAVFMWKQRDNWMLEWSWQLKETTSPPPGPRLLIFHPALKPLRRLTSLTMNNECD